MLLFLIELKATNAVDEKYNWELDRHISSLKEFVNSSEKNNNKEFKIKLSEIINWVVLYFTSS